MKDIVKALKERKEKLERIANRDYPIDPNLEKAHILRVNNAVDYINELDSLISFMSLPTSTNIQIVPINIFEKMLEKADYATIEDEGLYFRLAHVTSFPHEEFTLLYLFPLSSI